MKHHSLKPKILVARAIFPEALAKLEEIFDVKSNQEDRIFSPQELQKELSVAVGTLVLLKLSNVVVTPHIASATEKTRRVMVDLAIENLRAAIHGKTPPSLIH